MKNYGFMAKMYSSMFSKNLNSKILEVRQQFEDFVINSFKVLNIYLA